MSNPRSRWRRTALAVLLAPLVLVVAPVLLVLLVLAMAFAFLSAVCLRVAIWCWWCMRGRDILLVYSDSPVWHDYIEQNVRPHLGSRAVVLNWSQRKRWRISLASMAARHFGGSQEFNPIAVVFCPLGPTRTFRLWRPFLEFKRGHPESLQRVLVEFFGVIGVQTQVPAA